MLVIPIIVTTTAIVSGRPRIINTWLSVLILPGLLSDGASIADIVFSIPNSQPDRSAKPSVLQLIHRNTRIFFSKEIGNIDPGHRFWKNGI